MTNKLIFDPATFETGVAKYNEKKIIYRKYTVQYAERPLDPSLQIMNIYVSEEKANDHTVPIMLIHRDGGVGQAQAWSLEKEYEERHTEFSFKGHKRAGALDASDKEESVIARLLLEGFVIASPGVRGRESVAGEVYIGRGDLPMTIIDLKAAVRYLRFNKGRIPGDPERIISEGGSSGGGSSALLGASGNSPLYEKYLKEIGAADVNDDIFCAIVDSPIHDFEHIDIAYEWQFGPEYVNGLFADDPDAATISEAAKEKYIEYVDQLDLKDPDTGEKLSIRDESYTTYMLKKLNESLNKYLEGKTETEKQKWLDDEKNKGLAVLKDGQAVINSFASYIQWNSGRWMKYVGCYDGFDSNPSRENEAFGSKEGGFGHFSCSFAKALKSVPGHEEEGSLWEAAALKNKNAVRLINPYIFITGEEKADIAPFWYVRAGGHHDTVGAVFMNLCLLLCERRELNVNWEFCWRQIHTSISLKELSETLSYLKEIIK